MFPREEEWNFASSIALTEVSKHETERCCLWPICCAAMCWYSTCPICAGFRSRATRCICAAANDTRDAGAGGAVLRPLGGAALFRARRLPHGRTVEVFRGNLKQLVDSGGHHALIHCHTPVGGHGGPSGGAGERGSGARVVLYTAHGFHFFTGAPLRNWLLFYPAERFLARFTDLLITINREDEARARRFPARRVAPHQWDRCGSEPL